MNYKKLLHIFLCSLMAFSLFSCNEKDKNNPSNPDGGGGNEPSSSSVFFIKHPWNNGSWEWKQMTYSGNNTYTFTGIWGGVGANINTSADDSGAEWYEASKINGASSLSIGKEVTFTFVSTNGNKGTLSVSANGGGGTEQPSASAFYIKHPWNNGSWEWKKMSSSGNNTYTYTGIWGGVGANINTSSSDSGAEWYEASKISGASSLSTGTEVTFTFVSTNGNIGTLSVSTNGGGNNPGGGGGGDQGSTPNTPTGLQGSMAGSANTGFRVNLSWNMVSAADSYNIYRSSSENGSYSKIGRSQSNSYTDNNPYDGDNYYKVTAVNSSGESSKSGSINVYVDKNAFKPQFSSVKGSISNGAVKVTWSTKSGDGYGKPNKVVASIYDPNDCTYPSETFTGSSASSGSHTWPCAECYKDEYGKIQIKLEVSNEYGTNSHAITYYNGNWTGNF